RVPGRLRHLRAGVSPDSEVRRMSCRSAVFGDGFRVQLCDVERGRRVWTYIRHTWAAAVRDSWRETRPAAAV
ncbi:MAG: hypothetical protein ACXVH3_34210, partial [Solirubrobacteraceae bacterium]